MRNNNDCQNRREAIAALVLGELEPRAADELKNHIDTCQSCRALYQAMAGEEETIRSAFKAIADRSETIQDGLIEQSDKRSYQSLLHRAAPHTDTQSRRTRSITFIRRTIMKSRIAKLAAAAVIIIAVFWGLDFIGGPDMAGVAWGELADRVGRIRTCIFRGHSSTTLGESAREGEIEVFVSSEYGFRSDSYQDGKLHTTQYWLLAEGATISVMPEQKGYMRIVLTDERLEKMQRQGNDPREMIRQFMSAEYSELGRDVIDGIEVEGIETSDPKVYGGVFENFVARLWVDVETDLPVRMEMEMETQMGSGAGLMQMSMVMDGFEWDVELEPGIFEPNIPADYNLMAEVEMPDTKDEGKVIQGLRAFAEITDGRYPSSMTMMAVMQEAGKVFKSMDIDTNKDPTPEQAQKMTNKMMVLQTPYIFYAQLVQENKDPAYYGDTVTADDVNAVLMRWKVSDDEYRVIFGDLTTENVTAERLAELEEGLAQ